MLPGSGRPARADRSWPVLGRRTRGRVWRACLSPTTHDRADPHAGQARIVLPGMALAGTDRSARVVDALEIAVLGDPPLAARRLAPIGDLPAPDPLHVVEQADRALGRALREATNELAALDLAQWRPEVAAGRKEAEAALRAAGQRFPPGWPPPARALAERCADAVADRARCSRRRRRHLGVRQSSSNASAERAVSRGARGGDGRLQRATAGPADSIGRAGAVERRPSVTVDRTSARHADRPRSARRDLAPVQRVGEVSAARARHRADRVARPADPRCARRSRPAPMRPVNSRCATGCHTRHANSA